MGPAEMMRLAAGALFMGFLLLGSLHTMFAPLVRKRWGSDEAAEFDNSRALDALWQRYERGEVSWDKYRKMSRIALGRKGRRGAAKGGGSYPLDRLGM